MVWETVWGNNSQNTEYTLATCRKEMAALYPRPHDWTKNLKSFLEYHFSRLIAYSIFPVHSITGNLISISKLSFCRISEYYRKLIQRWLYFGEKNSINHSSKVTTEQSTWMLFASIILAYIFSERLVHIKYWFKYWYLISYQGPDYMTPLCQW